MSAMLNSDPTNKTLPLLVNCNTSGDSKGASGAEIQEHHEKGDQLKRHVDHRRHVAFGRNVEFSAFGHDLRS
jgi:hypothetical protein